MPEDTEFTAFFANIAKISTLSGPSFDKSACEDKPQVVPAIKGDVRQKKIIGPKFLSAPNKDKFQYAIFTEKP